jgi:L-threonylcarbamoyladenylate synthase
VNLSKLTIPTNEAVAALQNGGVGIMPTDTVYGIVARAADPQAVARLYALKHREHKPGTLIAANVKQLVDLGIKKRYLSAVEQWWPNSLSVIIPTGENLGYLHQGLDSLAIRVPKDEDLHAILEQTGPLITSSANLPGQPVANNVLEAQNYFDDAVDFYVDGGEFVGREPSTLIRIVDDAIEVIREGAVKINETGRIDS